MTPTIAAVYLIVHLSWNHMHGHSMTSVPMASVEACQYAAAKIGETSGRLTVRSWCVPTGATP